MRTASSILLLLVCFAGVVLSAGVSKNHFGRNAKAVNQAKRDIQNTIRSRQVTRAKLVNEAVRRATQTQPRKRQASPAPQAPFGLSIGIDPLGLAAVDVDGAATLIFDELGGLFTTLGAATGPLVTSGVTPRLFASFMAGGGESPLNFYAEIPAAMTGLTCTRSTTSALLECYPTGGSPTNLVAFCALPDSAVIYVLEDGECSGDFIEVLIAADTVN